MTDLSDAVVVITGAGGGIGGALARALAAQGARLALADLSLPEARSVAESIGGGARAYACDVAARGDVDALAADVLRDFGQVNLVFANAGVAVGGRLTETEPREFDWMFDVNVRGAFNTVQAFASAVAEAAAKGAPARIVLTGSENSVGLPATAIMTAYTATKHAVLAMADGLRRDLAPSGVKVSIFCPGLVNTRIWDARRSRQERYGGPEAAPKAFAAAASQSIATHGQDPALTARLCLEGLANDEFLIITDPKIREYSDLRSREVDEALRRLDERLARFAETPG